MVAAISINPSIFTTLIISSLANSGLVNPAYFPETQVGHRQENEESDIKLKISGICQHLCQRGSLTENNMEDDRHR